MSIALITMAFLMSTCSGEPAVKKPEGMFKSDFIGNVSGSLFFLDTSIVNIDIVLFGCSIMVDDVPFDASSTSIDNTTALVMRYAGTAMEEQVKKCDNPEIKVQDFVNMSYHYVTEVFPEAIFVGEKTIWGTSIFTKDE